MRRAGVIAALVVLSSCAPTIDTRRISVLRGPALNASTPVELSVVVIRDEPLVSRVQSLTAAEWVAGRDQLVADFPEQIEHLTWEFAPCACSDATCPQCLHSIELPPAMWDGVALFMFADFSSDEQPHRRQISRIESVEVALTASGLLVRSAVVR